MILKVRLIIALLFVSFAVKAQDVNYKFTGPIQKINGYVFGNEKDGFIKVDYNYMTLRIHKVDKDNYHTKEISITSDFYGAGLVDHVVYGNYSYMFYTKANLAYVVRIDLDGQISEPIKLSNGKVYSYYTVDFDDTNEFFILNFSVKQYSLKDQKINVGVYDLDFNLINKFFKNNDRKNPNPNFRKPFYNTKDRKLYFSGNFPDEIRKEMKKLNVGIGLYSLDSSGNLELLNDDINTDFIMSSVAFYSFGEEVILVGIAYSLSENKAFSFVTDDSYEIQDKLNFEFVNHVNYKTEDIETIKFTSDNFSTIILEDGSVINITSINVDLGEYIKNILITKLDSEGKIIYNELVSLANVNMNDIHVSADEKNVYLVYQDLLERVEIDGVKYDGKYIITHLIDEVGLGNNEILFNSEKNNNIELYNVFKTSFNPNPKTFINYAYKKDKEDMIIEVKFED